MAMGYAALWPPHTSLLPPKHNLQHMFNCKKNHLGTTVQHSMFLYMTNLQYKKHSSLIVGTAVAQWLRRCATNRKVAGSVPDGVIGIFH